jgi:hypothetical protein
VLLKRASGVDNDDPIDSSHLLNNPNVFAFLVDVSYAAIMQDYFNRTVMFQEVRKQEHGILVSTVIRVIQEKDNLFRDIQCDWGRIKAIHA